MKEKGKLIKDKEVLDTPEKIRQAGQGLEERRNSIGMNSLNYM